jgi:O-acetyl-ADP-ribose deacetylase (regulator of RNase III)
MASPGTRKKNPASSPKSNRKAPPLPIAPNVPQKVLIRQGDITDMDVDAIVNAANNDLILSGGVAGAIRRKGGEQIQRECNDIGTIPVGYAALTSGGNLKARHIIHAASMELGGRTTPEALRQSTQYSLHIAAERGLKTVAFPAIGTRMAGFPMQDCAEIMLQEATRHLERKTTIEKIYFVLFEQSAADLFQSTLVRLQPAPSVTATTEK